MYPDGLPEGVLAIDNRASRIGHENVAPDHQAVNPVRDDGLSVVEQGGHLDNIRRSDAQPFIQPLPRLP
jgi:hypothetical protein